LSKAKNHNSILFLTTLGLYLGLVMVGGTSPALAQRSAVRPATKIVSPSPGKTATVRSQDDLYVLSVVRLVEELNRLSKRGQFDWSSVLKYEIEDLAFCESDDSPSYLYFGGLGKANDAVNGSAVQLARHIFIKKAQIGLGDIYSHRIDYKFTLENDTFTVSAVLKDLSAAPVAVRGLTAYFEKFACGSASDRGKIVADHTEVTSQNDQIFIVTRLPRGSIDSLLRS
jgi:hypothetical protein